ncbi:MAG TPA: glutamine synthetase type III, partial [Clostridiales bacterium]|nr:glutamine synthetase type III [Clostridiales bacterium]
SSATLADINTALNTVVADSIMNVANRLKAADDVWAEANKIVAEIVAKHGKVVYNGNNYDAAWKQIAAKRGLPN